jgi:hypothetical protein
MISSFTNGDRASLSAKQKWQKVKTLILNGLGFLVFWKIPLKWHKSVPNL